jgi:hypothetical protein
MKKFWVVGAALTLILALAAVAIAQTTVTNTYTVTGSTSPTNAGTIKKPVPISITFNYNVDSQPQGTRPNVVQKYSIRFSGVQVNTNLFPKCTQAKIESGGPEACPARSIVGTGYIVNETGTRDDPYNKSINCNAKLFVINNGNNKGTIFVRGTQTATDPRERCDINLSAPIDANFVKRGNVSALEFVVPESLRHPLPSLSNAVKSVQSTIKRVTRRYRGRTRGFYEAVGGCLRGKRRITVVFTPEQGVSQTAQTTAKCRN